MRLPPRALVYALALPLAASAAGCRDHFAHELRPGTLSEIGSTAIRVYFWERAAILSISNEARTGACLELTALSVTVNGVPQVLTSMGGRSDGRTKGSFGPIDRTDSCDAARLTVKVPSDPSRLTDVVEVTDGTASLRAEFPALFAEAAWARPPPKTVHPGDTFRARVLPRPARGVGQYDPDNYVGASLIDGASVENGVKLTTRSLPDGDIELTVPKTSRLGAFQLYLSSAQTDVPASRCTAASCSGASEFVLTSPVVVAP